MMVVLRVGLRHLIQQRGAEVRRLLQFGQNISAIQLIPRRGHDNRIRIVLPKQVHRLLHLLRAGVPCAAQQNQPCLPHLIEKEFPEVLQIHLTLVYIHHGGLARHADALPGVLHSLHNLREFSHAGRLDDHPLRLIGVNHFLQRPLKVADQRTTDTAGIHLADFHARFLEEVSVHADFPELILNEHNFVLRQRFREKLANQRCFSGA